MQAPCARGRGSLLQSQPLTGGKADAAFSQQSRQCRRRTVQVGSMHRLVAPRSSASACTEVSGPACCACTPALFPTETSFLRCPRHPPLPHQCSHPGADSPRGLITAGQRSSGARAPEAPREHTPDAEAANAHHHGAASAINIWYCCSSSRNCLRCCWQTPLDCARHLHLAWGVNRSVSRILLMSRPNACARPRLRRVCSRLHADRGCPGGQRAPDRAADDDDHGHAGHRRHRRPGTSMTASLCKTCSQPMPFAICHQSSGQLCSLTRAQSNVVVVQTRHC